MRARAALILSLLAATLLFSGGDGQAASRLCRQLETQLVKLGRSSGNAQVRRYEEAIRRQTQQITRAERQFRRAGCGRGIIRLDRGAGAACPPIEATLRKMRANLRALQGQHRKLSGGRQDSARERRRILASIDANDCRGQPRSVARRGKAEDVSDPLRLLFGKRAGEDRASGKLPRDAGGRGTSAPRYEERAPGSGIYRPSDPSPSSAGGYRTLCVRACDGYFFPLSSNASPGDFDRDAGACAAMCPGTEVELFFHKFPEEESEEMMSRAGIRYTETPSAFLYRQTGYRRPANCACNPARGFSVIAGESGARSDEETGQAPGETAPATPMPSARPDPANDPETSANMEGGLDGAAIRRLVGASGGDPREDAGRKVRVVGPVFLPDPEEAIDLRSPVRTEVR